MEETKKFSMPKWKNIKRKYFSIQCGGPRGLFTLIFQNSTQTTIGRLYNVIKTVFSKFSKAKIIFHENIKFQSDKQELPNPHKPGSPIILPAAHYKQPPSVEVQIPNATPQMIRLTKRLFDVIEKTIASMS